MQKFVLHGAQKSSAAYRVRIALEMKSISYEEIFVDLRGGEQAGAAYRAINPQGLVPALQCPDGTLLTQSLAICEYCDEIAPSPALLPANAKGRARVRALAQIIACEMHPLNNMRVRNHIAASNPGDPGAAANWIARWSEAGFGALEAALTAPETGRFCHGDAPGLADLCLVPQVYNARLLGVELSPYANVIRIANACSEHPAFRAAHPDNLGPR